MTIPITGQPVVPDLSDPATFNTKSLNMFTWIMGSMLTQFNNVDPADFFAIQSGPMDATADRVLITGAGGLLQSGAGPLLANINATTIPGSLARFDGTTTGTKPAGVATGTVLTVRGAGTNNLSQFVVSGDGFTSWFRACVAGVWSDWNYSISNLDRSSQGDAETGTDNNKYMTPLRTAQAIAPYSSAETTITISSKTTIAHGLGVTPKDIRLFAICKTADSPYIVNEVAEVQISYLDESFRSGAMVSANATNVFIRVANGISLFTDTGTQKAMVTANWRFIVRAWK